MFGLERKGRSPSAECAAEVSGSNPLRSTTPFTLRSRGFVRPETRRGAAEMASCKHPANERLVTLHHAGALTDDEFVAFKAKLME